MNYMLEYSVWQSVERNRARLLFTERCVVGGHKIYLVLRIEDLKKHLLPSSLTFRMFESSSSTYPTDGGWVEMRERTDTEIRRMRKGVCQIVSEKECVMQNRRLVGLGCLLLVISTLAWATDKVILTNRSSESLWVSIKKKGLLGIDGTVKDYESTIAAGKKITVTGVNMPQIWVLPADQAKGKSDSARKKLSESLNLTQKLGHNSSNLSFDVDANDKSYLYYGNFALDEAFSVISLSDVHTRQTGNSNNIAAIKLRTQVASYLVNDDKNVQGVIFVGDSAGGYGKKSETKAYRSIWFDYLDSMIDPLGKHIFLVPGNHDTYWDSVIEPYPTKMMELIKEKHGSYMYHFNIGPVQFINLGLYPAVGSRQKDTRSSTLLKTSEPSLTWLSEILEIVGTEQPVVLMFHYPIHYYYSSWWSLAEKDALYNAIKNYNVVAILVGHEHANRFVQFRDKCAVIQAAAVDNFALLNFDFTSSPTVTVKFVNTSGVETSKTLVTGAPEYDLIPS